MLLLLFAARLLRRLPLVESIVVVVEKKKLFFSSFSSFSSSESSSLVLFECADESAEIFVNGLLLLLLLLLLPLPPNDAFEKERTKSEEEEREEACAMILRFVLSLFCPLVFCCCCCCLKRDLSWSFPPLFDFLWRGTEWKNFDWWIFSLASLFFFNTRCFWGLFFHPFRTQKKRHCCSTLNTHTHLIHIYNEKYGIVSCKYRIVFSRLRGERREKMFASLFYLSLSIRFLFSLRVFDDEWREEGTKNLCCASTREKYRERGRRWWISRRFSQEKEGDCLEKVNVMLISRLRTSQRARNVAFSTMMMCFLFLSRWRPLSFLSVVSTKRGENWERKDISKREKKPSREGAKPVGLSLIHISEPTRPY